MSQQPYQQPGQPGGYQQPGQPGYPQGGYPQPGQPPQQYGGYQGGSGYPAPGGGVRSGPALAPALISQILFFAAIAVTVLGVIGSFFAFSGYGSGSGKFYGFTVALVASVGFGGILLALSSLVKKHGAE